MEKLVKIHIVNNDKDVEVPVGSTIEDVYALSGVEIEHGPISAHVNNKVEGMHYRLYKQKQVEFLDICSSSGSRAYTRCTICLRPVRWLLIYQLAMVTL